MEVDMDPALVRLAAALACARLLAAYRNDGPAEERKLVTAAAIDTMLWMHSEAEGKYLGCRRWSKGAVDSYRRHGGVVTSEGTFGNDALRHDHLVPRAHLIEELFNLPPDSDVVGFLADRNIGVVITVGEHRLLANSGCGDRGDINRPMNRYDAVDIRLAEVVPRRSTRSGGESSAHRSGSGARLP